MLLMSKVKEKREALLIRLSKGDITVIILIFFLIFLGLKRFIFFHSIIAGLTSIVLIVIFFNKHKDELKETDKSLLYKLTSANAELKQKNIQLESLNEQLKKENLFRKFSQEQLILSKKKYKQIIDFLPNGLIVEMDNECILTNKVIEEICHEDEHEIEKLLRFVHNSIENNDLCVDKCSDKSSTIEYELKKLDGSYVNLEIKAAYFEDNNQRIIMLNDITQRKISENNERLLKQAMEYDNVRNEFFTNISHEFRTPINVNLGALKLIEMQGNKYSEAYKELNIDKYIKMMNQNSYRLLRLVNNLIDITKIDSKYFYMHIDNYNIVNVVEEITLAVSQYAESIGRTIIFDTDIEEKEIAFDEEKIERVVLNLLSNAVKFTASGDSIFVNVYDGEEYVTISIRDTGVGIPKDKIKLIFERFRQVDKSLSRECEGSGIGLSIVKSIVEMHKGEISVKSEYGNGSEFIIKLPSKIASNSHDFKRQDTVNGKIEKINIEFSDIYN